MILNDFFSEISDVLFPPLCFACSEVLPAGPQEVFCPECRRQITFITDSHCPVCGIIFPNSPSGHHLCGSCMENKPWFTSARAAVVYEGVILDAIHQFKYGRNITTGVALACLMADFDFTDIDFGIFDAIVPQVFANAPEAILLVATNPVDIMTHLAAHTAAAHGIPSTRVLGSGTTLDTARFRALLGRNLGVDPQHVHGYVVGEHGDSEVLTWSSVDIGGIPLLKYCQMSGGDVCTEDKALIDDQVRHAAYHIIEGKGSTYYGIGSAIAKITEVILNNQRAILTVCTPIKEVVGVNDVTISLPHLIGGDGIITTLFPSLDANETDGLQRSAGLIRGLIDQLEKEGLL